jgi:hypothetical protein
MYTRLTSEAANQIFKFAKERVYKVVAVPSSAFVAGTSTASTSSSTSSSSSSKGGGPVTDSRALYLQNQTARLRLGFMMEPSTGRFKTLLVLCMYFLIS